jgi:hypothetical protein
MLLEQPPDRPQADAVPLGKLPAGRTGDKGADERRHVHVAEPVNCSALSETGSSCLNTQ